jgi:hypothetical protein
VFYEEKILEGANVKPPRDHNGLLEAFIVSRKKPNPPRGVDQKGKVFRGIF